MLCCDGRYYSLNFNDKIRGMILIDYIYWHYVIAPLCILGLLRNYLAGTWHRFLIGTHFENLLAPWHRARPSDVGTTRSFGDKIANAIADFYIRIIAAIIRLVIILIGLLAEAVIAIAFITLTVVWLLWPVILVSFIVSGMSLL